MIEAAKGKLWALWRRRDDYRRVFGTPEGRRVLADLLREAGLREELLAPGDPLGTGHGLGRRRVGLHIVAILEMSDAEIMRLVGQAPETAPPARAASSDNDEW